MKFLLAFAFVAVASAIPMPAPESVQLPAADQPEIMEAPGFFKPNIEPVFIAPEVAAEFYKSFEVNPPMEYVHELAYEEPQPVNFVDVAENAESFVPVGDVLPIVFMDSAIPPRQLRAPLSEVAEVAEEIVPVPVNFVDDAESVAAEKVAPVPANLIAEESVAAEEIVPSPVNFVNNAENAEVKPVEESAVAAEIQPEPIRFVDAPLYDIDQDIASMLR